MKTLNKKQKTAPDKINGAEIEALVKKANDVGILSITAYGGMTMDVLKDAINSMEALDKYLAAHPYE